MTPYDNPIRSSFLEHQSVLSSLSDTFYASIAEIVSHATGSLRNGGKVLWCGNGGSAADSQHLAAELVGRFKKTRPPYASFALTTDTSVLTCISNDFGYDHVFSRQLTALASPLDTLIALSTSGSSPNICNAITTANDIGLHTVALTGNDGGKASQLASTSLVVPSSSTARIQEVHILVGHIICECIENFPS